MSNLTTPVQIQVPGPHLGGGLGWPGAGLRPGQGVAAGRNGLGLPAVPEGPLGLGSHDGSLGRLTLPRGIAVDERLRVYLLDRRGARILLHDPSAPGYDPKAPFVELPHLSRHPGRHADREDPRRLVHPVSLDADGENLYVVDRGARRVLVLAQDRWVLRDLWSFGHEETPLDVVAHGGRVYVLTGDGVYRFARGDERPRRILARPARRLGWKRMAADRDGRLYLLRAGQTRPALVDVFRPGRPLEASPVRDPAEVRDRFSLPAITTWPGQIPVLYVLPEPLARSCGRARPGPAPGRSIESSLTALPDPDRGEPQAGRAFVFDRRGRRRDSATVPPVISRLFSTEGSWISGPLDSKQFRCNWDVIELGLSELPLGTLIDVQTHTADDDPGPDAIASDSTDWAQGLTVMGTSADPGDSPPKPINFLIASPPGRYLWFRVTMQGDGVVSPSLGTVRLRLPRQSYVNYLPAVFLEDDASRRFLERFLAVFQATWDGLESEVDRFPTLADPTAVRSTHLDTLASWLGQTFENGWSTEQRRGLLEALPGILFARRKTNEDRPGGSRRGTLGAFRDHLAAVLGAVSGGIRPEGFPFVIEGFRDRDYRMLPRAGLTSRRETRLGGLDPSDPGELNAPVPPLWGPDLVGRFRLGDSSRLDESRLLPLERPDREVFARHANRFRVVIPAAMVPDATAESALRRAIEAEKPAHTAYELELIGPRFRLGVQSTVGIDTILGGVPATPAAAGGRGFSGGGRHPRTGRLGYDTVLSPAEPVDTLVRLGPHDRLGFEARQL